MNIWKERLIRIAVMTGGAVVFGLTSESVALAPVADVSLVVILAGFLIRIDTSDSSSGTVVQKFRKLFHLCLE